MPKARQPKRLHHGYVMIDLPGHPLANKDGYAMEQRVVLSEKLGRLLEPGEVVRWKNGDKADNRPENLELHPGSKYATPDADKPAWVDRRIKDETPIPPRPGEGYIARPTVLSRVAMEKRNHLVEQFWKRVDKDGAGGCWLWTGSLDDYGYGRPHLGGIHFRTHILSYELHHGPIPEGDWIVRHNCDVPACVNPAHLLLGTKLDNARDRDSRGRSGTVGSRNRGTRLTDDIVREIRGKWTGAWGQMSALTREYGINSPTLYGIVTRTMWQDVE